MFTGIVEKTSHISGISDGPGFRRLALASDWKDVQLGQSVAVNGCCLTIADIRPGELVFDVIQETLEKTNLGMLTTGDAVNVERPMKIGDRIDGHFVQGHIDGKALLIDAKPEGEGWRFRLDPPAELVKFIVPKGSVTLDGVSLTIAAIIRHQFEVALIPATLRFTTLGNKSPGWMFNLEADILTKTVVSWMERREPSTL
jgi:riboflavin synthase